jgi:hypothetical protein
VGEIDTTRFEIIAKDVPDGDYRLRIDCGIAQSAERIAKKHGEGQQADSTETEKRKLMKIPNYKSQITNNSQ